MQDFLDRLIAQRYFGGSADDAGVRWSACSASARVVVFGVRPDRRRASRPGSSGASGRACSRASARTGSGRRGLLQWLADGVKLLLKEDIIPAAADARAVPAGAVRRRHGLRRGVRRRCRSAADLIIADLNVGILYITAVTSLVVVGILMAGWASNNKWSLLGGIRSAAQIVSYEIPAGLSIFPVVLLTGTLSMQEHHPRSRAGRRTTGSSSTTRSRFVAFFILFTSLARRREPHAVRPARGRVGAGRRLRRPSTAACATCLLPRRVGQPLRDRRDRDDALPRRLADPAGHRQRRCCATLLAVR